MGVSSGETQRTCMCVYDVCVYDVCVWSSVSETELQTSLLSFLPHQFLPDMCENYGQNSSTLFTHNSFLQQRCQTVGSAVMPFSFFHFYLFFLRTVFLFEKTYQQRLLLFSATIRCQQPTNGNITVQTEKKIKK